MFAFLAVTQSLDIIVFVAGVVFFREALIGFVIVAVALFVSGFIPLIAARLWGSRMTSEKSRRATPPCRKPIKNLTRSTWRLAV